MLDGKIGSEMWRPRVVKKTFEKLKLEEKLKSPCNEYFENVANVIQTTVAFIVLAVLNLFTGSN